MARSSWKEQVAVLNERTVPGKRKRVANTNNNEVVIIDNNQFPPFPPRQRRIPPIPPPPPPLSHVRISRLPRIFATRDDISIQCQICLRYPVLDDELIPIPPCYHTFHAECIIQWLKHSGACPICRSIVN